MVQFLVTLVTDASRHEMALFWRRAPERLMGSAVAAPPIPRQLAAHLAARTINLCNYSDYSAPPIPRQLAARGMVATLNSGEWNPAVFLIGAAAWPQ
jgi:hypothetical protein